MISKWSGWLGKMQRPYTFAWNEKHVLFAFCISYGAAAWPFHHGEPVPDLSKVHVPPGDRPAVLRQVWGRKQQLGGLKHGL